MIYTVTFNPSLDYVMKTDNILMGHTNRSIMEFVSVGGKGINVSLILAEFKIRSVALGFVGGFTGDQLVRMINSELVSTDFVRVSGGDTRINVKLIGDEMTEINALGPVVSDVEVEELLIKISRLKDDDILVVGGSVPRGVSCDIYQKILKLLEGKNVKTVVDATGDLLINTLPFKPYLVKPNLDELGEIFDTKIESESDVLFYASKLQEMGARNVLVSLGKDGAILVDETGCVIKRKAVGTGAVNPVGAGDSMVAGFIAGAFVNYSTALDYGIAAGGATACSQGLADKETIDRFLKMNNNRVDEDVTN